jgi:hypothetical protein
MELNDFITTTLTQIATGVKEAQAFYKELGGAINPKGYGLNTSNKDTQHIIKTPSSTVSHYDYVCNVDFEVALSESSASKTNGGLGVMLGAFTVGGKKGEEASQSALTKIKFTIPVILP